MLRKEIDWGQESRLAKKLQEDVLSLVPFYWRKCAFKAERAPNGRIHIL